MKKRLAAALVLLLGTAARAQEVAGTIQNALDDINTIAAAVGAVVMGLVGVVGIGRAAYKFAHGDSDAVTSLVMGIVALFLGALCATFVV